MSSTLTSSGTHIDRKSLKKQDTFTTTITAFFKQLSSQVGLIFVALGLALALGVGVSLYLNHAEAVSNNARNELFLAETAIEKELKGLEGTKTSDPSGTQAESLNYKKLDVDSSFPEGISHFKKIELNFPKTRSAFEAQLKLGNLYFRHGDALKAIPWLEKATQSAPRNIERAFAFSALGYANENLGKNKEAIQAFEKAVNMGEVTLKGDLLLSIARNYEALHDTSKARSTYEKILADFPNSEFSKTAELYKNQL